MTLPILIEVTEDYVMKISDRLAAVSDNLSRLNNCENLLPLDLVEIKEVPIRNAVYSSEEGFCTSGSPWKEGTVGGILRYGEKTMGITSGHVHRRAVAESDSLRNDPDPASIRFTDSKVDVAFFTFSYELSDEKRSHLLPMQYMGDKSQVNLQIGEKVYKVGRSTGLTVGRLGSIESTFRCNGSRYEDHIQVLWNDDSCPFALPMDCGSLYCVQRGPMYVPIGIHRISDNNVSYGCSIWKAMEYFPEDADVDHGLNFVNSHLH